jgi:ABC-2 type transport system permease protein
MSTEAAAPAVQFKRYRSPGAVIGRFVARRSLRSAVFWAFIFGVYTAQKTGAYATAYATPAARAKIAASFSNNVGLNALLGQPHHINTVLGYSSWTTSATVMIVGGIWAFLLATKYFRGEEEAGRAEILLAGQTTARGAAFNILAGFGSALLTLYAITAVAFIAIGRIHSIGFGTGSALFYAVASVSAAALFLAVGALSSQLMPTRSRASSLAAIVFGVCFLVRAMADTTSLHWLLDISPLGWVENLQPLVGSQWVWLVPIAVTTAVLCLLTVWLAGRRDLGDSIVADNDSAEPHTALLNAPLPAAVRLTRSASVSWLVAIGLAGAFYGLLTKAAAQAFSQIGGFQKVLNRLEQTSLRLTASKLYLGIVFLMLMALSMAYVASAIGRVREDEAQGYVDNFLVRPVGRLSWLWGRIMLIAVVIVVICLAGGLGTWAGQASQHSGVPFGNLMLAGLNMIAPAVFTLGAGVLALGLRPRLTTLVAYGVLGWSFIISLASSGATLNHWLLDTSLLHQIALAPATNPNWTTNLNMIGLGALLALIGSLVFNSRDLQPE